jgi:hypothetical protein
MLKPEAFVNAQPCGKILDDPHHHHHYHHTTPMAASIVVVAHRPLALGVLFALLEEVVLVALRVIVAPGVMVLLAVPLHAPGGMTTEVAGAKAALLLVNARTRNTY